MDRTVARAKIVARLKESSAHGRTISITDDTEIYYDLRIYGHDLYEFLEWIREEFGATFPISISEYGPREGSPPMFFRRLRERRERKRRPYKSLKVRDILAGVEAGGWRLT